MSAIVAVSIAQAVVLTISAIVVLYQTRSVARTSRATFQHQIFQDVMNQRTESAIHAPEIFSSAPLVQEMSAAVGNSPEALARIRGMQDAMYNAYKLYKSHLIDAETWRSMSYQIAQNWQSRPIATVWETVSKTNAYSPDFIATVEALRYRPAPTE